MGDFMKDFMKKRAFEMSSEEFRSGQMERADISGRVNDMNKVTGRERVIAYNMWCRRWG